MFTNTTSGGDAFLAQSNSFGVPRVSVAAKLEISDGSMFSNGSSVSLGTGGALLGSSIARYEAIPLTGPDGGTAVNVIQGSPENSVSAGVRGASISGGGARAGDSDPDLELESPNRVSDHYGAVGGGYANVAGDLAGSVADRPWATVAGGVLNSASGRLSAIGGGGVNIASGASSVVSGGAGGTASGENSTVSGGFDNTASGENSVASGGFRNCAGGNESWAGGSLAKVRPGNQPGDGTCVANSGDSDGDEGTFIWADRSGGNFTSNGPNQFAIRAQGGLRWGGTGVNSTTSPAYTHLMAAGNACDGGSGVANSRTYLNHPLLNNNPNAVVLFTAFFGNVSGGVAPSRNPLAIYYSDVASGSCPAGRWVIYQTTVTAEALNIGSRYNIWFVLP
jgi:hypothetical protein